MRIDVRALSGDVEILAGSQAGRKLLLALVNATPSTQDAGPIFLDFEGITIVTSSFLRESVVAYRDFTRQTRPNLYPVVANPSHELLEELSFFLNDRGDAFWVCGLDHQGTASDARVVGKLDDIQRETLENVLQLGSASAPSLSAFRPDSSIGPTAWNNRLHSLSVRGLLIERRAGKIKEFKPVLEVNNGG